MTVVPSDERVAIAICHYSVNILLSLLQRDVHVSIKTRKDTCMAMSGEFSKQGFGTTDLCNRLQMSISRLLVFRRRLSGNRLVIPYVLEAAVAVEIDPQEEGEEEGELSHPC